MAKHVFVVLTNPVEGKEDTYNDWYTNVHLGDVLKVPGIVAARRFKMSDVQRGEPPFPWRYLGLYEIDTDDLTHTLAVLKERLYRAVQIQATWRRKNRPLRRSIA